MKGGRVHPVRIDPLVAGSGVEAKAAVGSPWNGELKENSGIKINLFGDTKTRGTPGVGTISPSLGAPYCSASATFDGTDEPSDTFRPDSTVRLCACLQGSQSSTALMMVYLKTCDSFPLVNESSGVGNRVHT
ncbi:hypothetical protein ZHAS_00005391 [Anopheles sinensis]|uniref:Uncharacterized protein n=1 Tax=Anopheles sinensis TaxID=74873 RepID=A0A084VJH1_ANOSI|nr:hypothetical protein ZHAS_00005391 [Anopheles sinensis]